ncbi:MAG: hypothetical protein GY719_25400 [bacterium]|nr:hypothetical protein [bacterium]
MELPTLPAERGHALGVRRRVERSFPAVRIAYGCADVVTEALSRRFAERLKSMAGGGGAARGEADGGSGLDRYISVPDFVLNVGRDIEELRDEMVRADLALAAQRRVRRRACGRRDWRKRKLYDARVRFKKDVRQRLDRKDWKLALTLKGETSRDPHELARQANLDVAWASGPHAPRIEGVGVVVDWAEMAAPLVPLRDDLWAAIDVVYDEAARVNGKLEARIWAMQAFDEWYGRSARWLESTFFLVGLPTLAAAVRPHLKGVGRVGRPPKSPPADLYPDLVERVRAAGLLSAAEPERRAAPAESDERHLLASWMAAYRQAIVPYLSFLASLRARDSGSGAAAGGAAGRSAVAWPARTLARWRGRGEG